MRTKTTLTVLVLLALGALPALASSPAAMPVGADDNSPSSITVDIKCRIAEIDAATSTLVLVDLETETPHEITLEDTVKLRARRKRDFQGRKKLGLADLRAGQELKVTVFVADGSIRSITVVKAA